MDDNLITKNRSQNNVTHNYKINLAYASNMILPFIKKKNNHKIKIDWQKQSRHGVLYKIIHQCNHKTNSISIVKKQKRIPFLTFKFN